MLAIQQATFVTDALPALVREAFLLPRGIIPRMGLLASGWVRPGDKFRETRDVAWWKKPFAYALWNPLATYAKYLKGDAWDWSAPLAAGDESALSDGIRTVNDYLQTIQRAGLDKCAPWIIPTAANTMPLPNPICPPPQIDKIVEPIRVVRDAIPEFPWWLLALVAVVVVGRKKR